MTELGGTQICSLMEVLPGIAQVLRSPVADAIVNLIRAACRVREFDIQDAEEMLKYAVRRNLMGAEESERVLAEAKAIVAKRTERAAEREHPKKPAPAAHTPSHPPSHTPSHAPAAKPKAKPRPAQKPKASVKSRPVAKAAASRRNGKGHRKKR